MDIHEKKIGKKVDIEVYKSRRNGDIIYSKTFWIENVIYMGIEDNLLKYIEEEIHQSCYLHLIVNVYLRE